MILVWVDLFRDMLLFDIICHVKYLFSKLWAHLKHPFLLNQMWKQGIEEPLLCYQVSPLSLLFHFRHNDAYARHHDTYADHHKHLDDWLELGVQHRPHLTSVWAASNQVLQEVVLRGLVWPGDRSAEKSAINFFQVNFEEPAVAVFHIVAGRLGALICKSEGDEEAAWNEFAISGGLLFSVKGNHQFRFPLVCQWLQKVHHSGCLHNIANDKHKSFLK